MAEEVNEQQQAQETTEEHQEQTEQAQTSEETKTEKTEANESEQEEKYVPQSKLDEIVQKRLAREREKYADYDDLKTKLSEYEKAEKAKKEAEMSEVEKLQARIDEYEKTVEEANQAKEESLKSANNRLIKSEFKLLAKESGIRKDALDAAFKLADFDSVDVDEEGNVQGVKEVIESLKDTNKFLFGANDYADPSPGQHETKREPSKDQAKKKLEELEAKARKSGRIDDKVAYANYKRELGI